MAAAPEPVDPGRAETQAARPWRRRHRVQWGLWTAALLLLIGLQGLQLHTARDRVAQTQEERLRRQAGLLEEALSRQFVAIDAGLRSLVSDLPAWQVKNDGADVQRRLKALDAAIVGTRTLAVLGEDGRVLASSRAEAVGLDASRQTYFAQVRSHNEATHLYVTTPYRTQLGAWTLNLVRVLQHADGRFAGAVVATLDPEWLAVTVGAVNYADDMWSGLTHTGGGLLFLAPAPKAGLEGAYLAMPGSMFSRHLASGQDETVLRGVIAVTGQGDRVIVQRTLHVKGLPHEGSLVIGTSRSLNGMLADWREQVAAASTLTVLLALLTAGALALLQCAERRRLQAEQAALQAVEATEQRWRLALESSGLGVWEFDPRSGVAYQSPAWKRLIGHTADELQAAFDSFRQRLHPDDQAAALERLQQHLRGEAPDYRAEFRLRCADGSWRWMASSGRVVTLDEQGRPARVVGTMADIEPRREAERLRADNQRIQARLEVKRAFLSQMSHEFRTPLNAVAGFAEILRRRLGQGPQSDLVPYAEQVLRGAHALLQMVSDVLEYSRLERDDTTLHARPVALAGLVQAAVDEVRPAALARGLSVRDTPCPPQAVVNADPDRLRRVLVALLDNAVAYNRDAGAVDLRCEPVSAGPAGWQVVITDTGCGMSAKELALVFEPLHRGRHAGSAVGGTGLGLVLARWYLQRMGGALTIDSRERVGTEVRVTLPAAELGSATGEDAGPERPLPG